MLREILENKLNEGKITDFFAGIKVKLNDRKLDKEAKKLYQKLNYYILIAWISSCLFE